MDKLYLEYRKELAETVANEIKKQILASYDELSAQVRQPIEDQLNHVHPAANDTQETFFKLLVMHQIQFPTFDAERLWAWFLAQNDRCQHDLARVGVAKANRNRRLTRQWPVKSD